ncbi:unnamed protein product [Protopolystoma xenopodis]|uniref:Peptidase M13 N-terminal domain-containing protein n=1 Tax=Protopolystoma xenopodis TaxID=117903 RepID=A0A3S5FGK4_9PLAT|nr:unnamed protein product [Protopolystoma xenopodis]
MLQHGTVLPLNYTLWWAPVQMWLSGQAKHDTNHIQTGRLDDSAWQQTGPQKRPPNCRLPCWADLIGVVCLDRTCIEIAGQIFEAIDETVSPCDDFYSFACNGWKRSHRIPYGKSSWSQVDELLKNTNQLVQQLLGRTATTINQHSQHFFSVYRLLFSPSGGTTCSIG